MSKCDKETLRDVFLGIYATMLNTEMAQSSETLSSINGDAERKLRIFPKKFTADYESKSIRITATSSLISFAIAVTFIQSMENALAALSDFSYWNVLSKLQTSCNTQETGKVCL